MNNNRTTDEISVSEPPEEQRTRFIDVHIYDDYEPEQEAPPSVESQAEAELEPASRESDQEHAEPVHQHHQQRYSIALYVGLVCVVVVSALLLVSLLPLFTPDATVTLVPNTQQIRMTTSILVTTGQATGTQLTGRALAAITMSQERTIPTTGKGHQDAKAAHGYITFYNAATYGQTVTAGTVLTGADGIEIVTDQDASIPAVSYPTLGQASIPAHAVITGPAGNIRAGDIYGPCCRLNVSAVNSAFSEGQQARDYQTVTQEDISTVVSSLKTGLDQSVQAALQTQVHADETLITPLPCEQNSKPDHQPGEEATQVQITVSETCTGMVYSTQAYQNQIEQIINQQASKQVGQGYSLTGGVQNTITQTKTQGHNRTELQVNIAAIYAYQISSQQQQDIKTLVAGKSKAQATNRVLHIPGIQSVSVVSSATIPTDIKHIKVIIVYVG